MIEPSADVAPSAMVAPSARVWHLAQVREDATIGEETIVGRGAYIGEGVRVGNRCKIQNYALIYEPASLADGVFVGPAAVFTNDHCPRAINPDGSLKSASDWERVGVTVDRGAAIGARAVCVAPVRIGAWASLYQERIDLNLAQMMLKDFVSNPDDNEITVSLIMSQCAVYFGVTIEQMGSSERSHNVVEARQIAMYLCRELTDLSLPKIGQAFGRDHTTVMHANKKISKLMKEKRETFNHVSELTNRIKQKARES